MLPDIFGHHEADAVFAGGSENGFGGGVNHRNESVSAHAGSAYGAPFFMRLVHVEQHRFGARDLGGSYGKTEVGGVLHAVKEPNATTGFHDLFEGVVLGAPCEGQSHLSTVGRHAPHVVGRALFERDVRRLAQGAQSGRVVVTVHQHPVDGHAVLQRLHHRLEARDLTCHGAGWGDVLKRLPPMGRAWPSSTAPVSSPLPKPHALR